jgi:serine/threonine protein phosphatase PrpC
MRTITSHATAQGTREHQEDRSFINSTEDGLLIAVFDGHGGEAAAAGSATHLMDFFNQVGTDDTLVTVPAKMKKLFELLAVNTSVMVSGTTASIVFIPSTLDRAFVGVVGDSPVVIRNADGDMWKAPEHNVNSNPAEVAAAKGRGGVVINGYLFGRKNKGLNPPGTQMARALGDVELDDVLSREPEIFEISLGKDSFVLVASDGLMNSNQGANDPARAVIALVDRGATAGNLVKAALDAKTGDNATAVLVRVVE